LFEAVTLNDAGVQLGASPTHLVRCFTRTFGVAPHAYVLGRRIDAARRRLLDGRPLAEVAVGVGFHDQSHLTRHFRRHVGTTPARYARTAR
jgi:AraC-like DNA-binding protein